MPAPVRPRRALAIVAAVVAGIELLVAPLNAVVLFGLLSSGTSPSMISPVSAAISAASGVLALIAIGFAVASLLRREQAKVLAGAALGVGVAAIIGVASGFLQALLFAAL